MKSEEKADISNKSIEQVKKFERKKKMLLNKIIRKIEEYPLHRNNGDDKDVLKKIHEKARVELLIKHRKFLTTRGNMIIDKYFANGTDIIPENIEPQLVPVRDKLQWDIFKTARFTWSLPYTFGYGRRLCFLIMDRSNGKLIGILGCQSPTLGLSLRNQWLGLKGREKVYKLNETMDIFTLGAVPPYNMLLGGKLVAMCSVSNEVRNFYKEKYGNRRTEMEDNPVSPNLILLTTTSAYGRSSLYNRVKYKNELLCFSLGYTKGIGTFKYTDEICNLMKEYLLMDGIKVEGGYGNGPNYKFRLINTTLRKINEEIDIKKRLKVKSINELVQHDVQREVFLFPLAANVKEYVSGLDNEIKFHDYKFKELADYWKERYMKNRAESNTLWKKWDKGEIKRSLLIKDI
ncbi:MAG: hypothetical protein HPY66_2927 [Firmicutes bacterium]|nr:hypothetical protein [Bacillota bacterium]